ncbi:ORF6N domain-containing protein [bacterium]|nr:ORF6N domain-containing protein [bacterium]
MGNKPINAASGIVKATSIQSMIFTIRGIQVMVDSDLAKVYNVEIRRLNEQVKRNIERFPESFRFQLTEEESENLRSQIAISISTELLRSQIATLEIGRGKHRKYLPYVFTEQGVSMLSAVLRSETAIKVSIQIINAFVEMRKFIQHNTNIFARLDSVERRQITFESETEKNFEKVFQALEAGEPPKQGIFYDGQVYDAYSFVADLIRRAKKSLILIDNYLDDSVLTLFCKRKKGVTATIYTKTISKQLALDLKKHNEQYPPITLEIFKDAHDRFLIIDEKEIYHIGASLKDLGKKWFAFSRFESGAVEMLNKLGGGK